MLPAVLAINYFQEVGTSMNYDLLLDFVTELGYNLAMSGAETYRIEESINRILAAYGIESQVFAITNSLTVSIRTAEGKSITRMKRIGYHGNDLDAVERFNSLSRRICAEKPEPEIANIWLAETCNSRVFYKLPITILGSFLGSAGFGVFFGGSYIDGLCAGICGIMLHLTDRFLGKHKTNHFFKTIACAFIMTMVAYITGILNIADNTDMVIIGALMMLVPGLLFTNAIRDIIYGDTNSGINRIVQVFLIAAAIALGTGVAWNLINARWDIPLNAPVIDHSTFVQCIASFIGCTGFFILFNIHGSGAFLCSVGGFITWAVYCAISALGGKPVLSAFIATLFAALYAEIMARIRKYPTISYLIISLFPLIPGAGIYYTTNHLIQSDMAAFTTEGTTTIAIAGVIAVGILLVSSIVRLIYEWVGHKHRKELR